MNIKILLPALAAAFLLSACGSIVPKPQTDLFTIAKFESDNTIVGQIANPEKQIVAYYDAEHRENAKPAKGGYYRMLLGRTAEGRAVIQDFYQDNGMRQISPVIIPDDTKLKLSTPLEIGLNGWHNLGTLLIYNRCASCVCLSSNRQSPTKRTRENGLTTILPCAFWAVQCRHLRPQQPISS